MRKSRPHNHGEGHIVIDELAQQSFCDRFDDLVAILSGEPAVETLEKCLCNAGARHKTNLRNNSFRVQFDADGNMTITAE